MLEKEDVLLTDLHRQFAENANNGQQLFLKLFVALLAIFTVFGYVLIHTTCDSGDFIFAIYAMTENSSLPDKFSISFLIYTVSAVECVLFFLTIILILNGWGFRREQVVNDSIRRSVCDKNAYNTIFKNNKYGLGRGISSMPDYYEVFAAALIFVKVVLVVFVYVNFKKSIYDDMVDLLITVTSSLLVAEAVLYISKMNKISKWWRKYLYCRKIHYWCYRIADVLFNKMKRRKCHRNLFNVLSMVLAFAIKFFFVLTPFLFVYCFGSWSRTEEIAQSSAIQEIRQVLFCKFMRKKRIFPSPSRLSKLYLPSIH
ncbi:hypothetical protein, partial [Fibrobacter sp. UWEL]|uniref:hypothetical protein n=1 Tax=Fibrobacter sp. UWEL TaxID=1896209 RepID=UPI00091AC005